MLCRLCDSSLDNVFIDLGHQPPSNSLIPGDKLFEPEVTYPLIAMRCGTCSLVQVPEIKSHSEIFSQDYVYFSSGSTEWLAHAKRYAEMAQKRFNLGSSSSVVEIASNDGYLLQYFKALGVPSLGIEPSASTARVAEAKGIETLEKFFDSALAVKLRDEGRSADLIVGNNVLAHVPPLGDFIKGMKILLKPNGTVTMEFPHLVNLVEQNQFDTVYHEHFSYFTLHTAREAFNRNGLEIYDVEELPTHGGSLRIYAKHKENNSPEVSPNVGALLARENEKGVNSPDFYANFKAKVASVKFGLLEFLVSEKKKGRRIAAYGAAAKGNTLLNFCGVKNDMVDYAVDTTPFKQGKYLPGSHILVHDEEKLRDDEPDTILILPWNHKKEIIKRLTYTRNWGAKLVTAIPRLEVL